MGRRAPSKLDLLREVPLFATCKDGELRRIASMMGALGVPEGSVLTSEDSDQRLFYIVGEGLARASIEGKVVAELAPGSFFGAMGTAEGPKQATVTSVTPMRLYTIQGRVVDHLFERAPTVSHRVLRTLAERVREAERGPTEYRRP